MSAFADMGTTPADVCKWPNVRFAPAVIRRSDVMEQSANGRLEPVMLHDVGGNFAMPRRRRIEMNFRLKCRPLAGSADQINDLGLDGLNISLIPINRVHMIPNVKDGRRIFRDAKHIRDNRPHPSRSNRAASGSGCFAWSCQRKSACYYACNIELREL
jgi:hypothetical protein